jgi:hypothetical protein
VTHGPDFGRNSIRRDLVFAGVRSAEVGPICRQHSETPKEPRISMGKADKDRMRKKKERQKKENEASASKPATHPCGCSKADGSPMMLDECEAGQSLCCLTNGNGWECGAPFPRRHIRLGDASSPLYVRCLKHRMSQYSSDAAIGRRKAHMAVTRKMKRGTAKESERQTKKKTKQLGRILPTGDVRKLLRRLRPTFEGILAKSAHLGQALRDDDEDDRLLP